MDVDPPVAVARRAFRAAVVRWAANIGSTDGVIRTAADLLAAGMGAEALAALAGLPYGAYQHDFGDSVRDAVKEVSLPFVEPASEDALTAALRLLAEEVLAGAFAPRELARWAHQRIGHGGPPEAQALVDLDDRYDLVGYMSGTVNSVDAAVRHAARKLLEP